MENAKRKRGRPRKNVDLNKKKNNVENKEENIVLFLALSDEEQNSEDDNRFTVNDTDTRNDRVDSITNSDSGSDSDTYDDSESDDLSFDKKQLTVKTLIEEIKKRDAIISNLKNKSNVLSTYTATKHSNINYHCTILVNSSTNEKIEPTVTESKCWWCDYSFDTLPIYIPNYLKNGKYYVFGNFCSFNCAAKYNSILLKDYKRQTRHALICSLKEKITGYYSPIKLAPERELLQSKGGTYSIDQYRKEFDVLSLDVRMNIPPTIPLIHVIEEKNKD